MSEAVVVSACRTAIGTFRKGTLVNTDAFELARTVVEESVKRAGLGADDVDDVILGEVLAGGGDIARYAALTAGLTSVPGAAVNRHCASGLTAVTLAAGSVRAGMDDIVIAGGVQSSSTQPLVSWRDPQTGETISPWMAPSHPNTPEAPNQDMSITVGWNAARLTGISREEMDAWALRSHQRAVASIDAGHFLEEIVPVNAVRPGAEPVVFEVDEHPRRDSSLERLAGLKVLHPEIEGFSITAGNSSGINDAAAAVVVASGEAAAARGLAPLATIRSWASVGVDPIETGLAPSRAIPKALRRAGLSVDQVDLWEINEAFASVPIATCAALGIDPAIVNVNGSGCSLGHPIAATGARMITTLIYELRRRGGGTAVASMCAGGGIGSAAVIEVPAP